MKPEPNNYFSLDKILKTSQAQKYTPGRDLWPEVRKTIGLKKIKKNRHRAFIPLSAAAVLALVLAAALNYGKIPVQIPSSRQDYASLPLDIEDSMQSLTTIEIQLENLGDRLTEDQKSMILEELYKVRISLLNTDPIMPEAAEQTTPYQKLLNQTEQTLAILLDSEAVQ